MIVNVSHLPSLGQRQVPSCLAMAHSSQLEPEHFGLEPLWYPVSDQIRYISTAYYLKLQKENRFSRFVVLEV